MTQHVDVVLPMQAYTRDQFAALRAYCLGLPIPKIQATYFHEDSAEVTTGLEAFLKSMQADLIARAIDANPMLAAGLKTVRHGGHISLGTLKLLIDVANLPPAKPALPDPLSKWFRVRLVESLKSESLRTLQDLKTRIERAGSSWWRPIPRLGALRAQVLVSWLQRNAATLGPLQVDHHPSPTPTPALLLDPQRPALLAPLDRVALSSDLDGSRGINRNHAFCFIQAKNDLQAVETYLARFIDQPHTLRAYRKELERFLLWSVMVAGKPMSSLLVDDIEAYKTFLKAPSPSFCGPKAPRLSPRWKPFIEGAPLSGKSQRQAFIIIQAALDYLVRVRYLGGNPMAAVTRPSSVKERKVLQIGKALPLNLWQTLIDHLKTRCQDPKASQDRISLAALLLMGDSGLRRHEAAGVRRDDLVNSPYSTTTPVHFLTVLGKGNKVRLVPVSARTLDALRDHWVDRGLDFDSRSFEGRNPFLLAPLIIPGTAAGQRKHEAGSEAGYHPTTFYKLVKDALKRLMADPNLADAFLPEELDRLCTVAPHGFRHTFGTQAVAKEVPLDVVQKVLGHASLSTTSVYVTAEDARLAEEAGKYFATLGS